MLKCYDYTCRSPKYLVTSLNSKNYPSDYWLMTRSPPLQSGKTREWRMTASSQISGVSIKEPPGISDYTRVPQQGVAPWHQGRFDRAPFSLLAGLPKEDKWQMHAVNNKSRQKESNIKEGDEVIVTELTSATSTWTEFGSWSRVNEGTR